MKYIFFPVNFVLIMLMMIHYVFYIFYSAVFMNRNKTKKYYTQQYGVEKFRYYFFVRFTNKFRKKAFHSSVLPIFRKDSNKHVYVN